MIALEDVRMRIGRRWVLDGASLDIPEGGAFGLAGRLGAGKSSVLRLLATLARPSGGTVLIGGVPVDRDPDAARRLVGYLPQRPPFYERQTAREYLEFYAGVHGVRSSRRSALARDLLEVLDLGHHAGSEARDMTRGERRRLALGRVLVHDPAALLLDEPTGGLDDGEAGGMNELLRELRDLGKTMLITGGSAEDLEATCRTIGWLEGGQVVTSPPVLDDREGLAGRMLPRRTRTGLLGHAPPGSASAASRQ